MNSGIYCITCEVTGEFYIGKASNFGTRFAGHLNRLDQKKHCCKKLQELYNAYGVASISFRILEAVSTFPYSALGDAEWKWMVKLRPPLNEARPDYDAIDAGLPVGVKILKRFGAYPEKNGYWKRLGTPCPCGRGPRVTIDDCVACALEREARYSSKTP